MLAFQHGDEIFNLTYLWGGLSQDIKFGLIASFPVWLLIKAVEKINKKWATPLLTGLILVGGLTNILLITYFSATLVPLGPEFWSYSPTEMTDTVIASENVSIWGLLFFIICGILLWNAVRTVFQWSVISPAGSLRAVGIAAVVILITMVINKGTETGDYSSNKLGFFVTESLGAAGFFSPGFTQEQLTFEEEYPFLRTSGSKNVLGDFFTRKPEPPNIVFIIVESLGGEFVGENGKWAGFAPYLDSLANRGLYWENGLSLSGRTFGLMPALFGSLPPTRGGYMSLGPDYPNHQTLISLLDRQGYHTAFYSGFDTYFDKLNYFLDYQQIDFVLGKQQIRENYITKNPDAEQNYWGYDDKTMFDIVSSIQDTQSVTPRLEIYHTLQSHSPFTTPQREKYETYFNQRLEATGASKSQQERFHRYSEELKTLLFTDNAIKNFIENYRERPEFDNTIFIVTGDHWLVPIPQDSQISRYHVPIIIYSPLLKQPAQFESVNTHANIAPSITSFLRENSGLGMPDSVHWLGSQMDTARSFRNIHSIPLMKNKNQLNDYIGGHYFLSGDNLYKLREGLRLEKIGNPDIKDSLKKHLREYKAKSRYALNNNKLYPGSAAEKTLSKYDFIAAYDSLFSRIDSLGMGVDQQFQLARQLAFDDQYNSSRAIARRLLLQYPDYHDVRLLLGRTHAWEGNYDQARNIFRDVLQRDPSYYDTYNALFDTEYWDRDLKAALAIIKRGLEHHPHHEQFMVKKIRVLTSLDRNEDARKIFEILKQHHPDNQKLPELKQRISD